MADNFEWTVSIIAQVDDFSAWEYINLRKTIEWQEKVENIRYVIFDYRQNERRAIWWELNNTYQSLEAISETKDVNLTDPKILKEFFEYVAGVPSKHHMLITWGHGAGLGYFYFKENVDTKTKNNLTHGLENYSPLFKQLEKGLNRRNANLNHAIANLSPSADSIDQLTAFRFFKYKVEDCFPDEKEKDKFEKRTKELLTAETLAEILKEVFEATPIDLYIANNCYTNMFEVGYALRKQVIVYVASQSIVPFAGINYDKLFEQLEKNPDMDKREYALVITDSFLPRYTEGSFANAFMEFRPALNPRHFTISVNDLTYYQKFFDVTNELCNHLMDKLKTDKEKYMKKIDIARNLCGDFAQGVGYIDFTNFFTELIKGFQDDDPGKLKIIYKKFFSLKEKALLSIVNPGELFRLIPGDFYSQSPQLYSIFFPSRFKRSHVIDEIIQIYFDQITSAPLWNDWVWPTFLQQYWNQTLDN